MRFPSKAARLLFLTLVLLFFPSFLKAIPAPEPKATEQTPKLFVATKAFIQHEGKILVLRESARYAEGTQAGFFDVVGGRMSPGEKVHECLIREIKEETGLDVTVGRPFFVGEWRPVIKGEPCQIVGIFFECFADSKEVNLSEDHMEYKWIEPEAFLEAQLIPVLHHVFEAYLQPDIL